MDDNTHEEAGLLARRITRRSFLKLAGVVFVSTTVVTILESCAPPTVESGPASSSFSPPSGTLQKYGEVPETPSQLPAPQALEFFNEDQAKLVDAIAGRILPGTPDDPGAREGDVFLYTDHKLSYKANSGFVEPTYFQPPFARLYKGDNPPANATGEEGQIWVSELEIDRYGFQGKLTLQETYQNGLKSVDKYSDMKFKKKFVDLTEAQQDQILEDMDNGVAKGFEDPSDRVFFQILRDDVIEGMFCDPVYGGNKDMVGWKLIGYPGAQRAYTPVDLNTEGHVRPPQSIAQLHKFRAGNPANPYDIVPPSGSGFEPTPQGK